MKTTVMVVAAVAYISFVAFTVGHATASKTWQQQALEHGCVQHDTQTGKWEWKENSDENNILSH